MVEQGRGGGGGRRGGASATLSPTERTLKSGLLAHRTWTIKTRLKKRFKLPELEYITASREPDTSRCGAENIHRRFAEQTAILT